MDDEKIFGTIIAYVVSITKKVPDQCYEPRTHIHKICLTAHNANSSFIFDVGGSYIAKRLIMVCRFKQRVPSADMYSNLAH